MMRHMAETNLKLLDGIPESEWENMGSILDGRIQEFEAGKLIWNIGDTCTEFAVVLSGMVAAYTESLKQVESLVAKFGQGRCFGEMLPLSGACSPVKDSCGRRLQDLIPFQGKAHGKAQNHAGSRNEGEACLEPWSLRFLTNWKGYP